MKTYGHGLDRDAAERLLDGGPGDPRNGSGALAGVLAAASAPARDGELAGEDLAVSAFRVAAARRSATPRRRGFAFARLVPVKIAAVALATATAASGMVLVGGIMGLPVGPLSSEPDSPPPSIPLDGTKSSARPDDPGPRTRSGSASPKAPSRPALVNLCRVYMATEPSKRAQQLAKPSLRVLVDAAGGVNRVQEYCAALAPSPRKTQGRDGTASGDGATNKKRATKGPQNGNEQGDDEGSGGDDDTGNGDGTEPQKGYMPKPDRSDPDTDDEMSDEASGASRQRPTTTPTPAP
ncbi:hypothetical protein ACQP1W_11730 [Spirillospora sp. CA-255316]